MYTDDAIEAVLGPLRPITYRHVPCAGDWNPPPFDDRVINGRTVAVVCEDPGLQAMVVDREDGRVLHVDPDNRLWLVNASVAHFLACARAHERAVRQADQTDEEDDDAFAALEQRLLADFAEIYAASDEDINWFWLVAVDTLRYGI
jgi:SUKH-4 immunity protein